jgi:hypothetical protein
MGEFSTNCLKVEALAGIAARLVGDGVLANVLAFKLLGGFFWADSVGLVALILRQVAPQPVLAGVILLAWNPVILYYLHHISLISSQLLHNFAAY